MAQATVRWRRPTRPGSRAVPLLRAIPRGDRVGRSGSAESGAWRARAATTATAALGLACVHRGDVHGGRERAEVGSEHRLRGLALEGVRGPGQSRAHTDLNARHASQEPNSAAEFRRGRARGARARLSPYVRRTYERATPGGEKIINYLLSSPLDRSTPQVDFGTVFEEPEGQISPEVAHPPLPFSLLRFATLAPY